MKEITGGYQLNRRLFLHIATAAEPEVTGATLLGLISPLTALAEKREPTFVTRKDPYFTLNNGIHFCAGTNNHYPRYQSHFMIDNVH